MESTPKRPSGKYSRHGCQRHSKLRHQPLQFSHSGKSKVGESFSSVFEESPVAGLLGDIDSSWFDDERWNLSIPQETQQHGEHESCSETIPDSAPKTPRAGYEANESCTTPGLFSPRMPSPVARLHKDDSHPQDTTPLFAHPKRLRRVPSALQTTPTSQVITSHQPATTVASRSESMLDADPPPDSQEQTSELRFSPFPTWNPTLQKGGTPLFMKQLFKTPSSLLGFGERRACSTPLQPLSTPQRLSRSLGAEPDESDLSWTSSLATPPMSSKGNTVMSSTKKGAEDDSFWSNHIVAKALFREGNSQFETDGEDDQGTTTQPLPTIKLPSITDESQDEEFTLESEDGGESEKRGRDTFLRNEDRTIEKVSCDLGAEISLEETGKSKLGSAGKSVKVMTTSSDIQNGIKTNPDNTCELISSTSDIEDSGQHCPEEMHIVDIQVEKEKEGDESHALLEDENQEPLSTSLDGAAVAQDKFHQNQPSAAPSCGDVNAELANTAGTSKSEHQSAVDEDVEKVDDNHNIFVSPPGSRSGNPPVTKSQSSQNSNTTLGSLPMNEKSTLDEVLGFLFTTPPSRRAKKLAKLGTLGSTDTNNETRCNTEKTDHSVHPDVLPCHSTLQGDSRRGEDIPSIDPRFPEPEHEQNIAQMESVVSDSGCDRVRSEVALSERQTASNPLPLSQQGKTPKRPAPEVDLLSPISPNYAEALCRVTDDVSMERLSGDSGKSQVPQTLGVERDLAGEFDDVAVGQPPCQTVDQSKDRSSISHNAIPNTADDSKLNSTSTFVDTTPNSESIPQNFSSVASFGFRKHVMPQNSSAKVQSNISTNLASEHVSVNSRFSYSAAAPRSNCGGSISKTLNWMSRAVYVEEEEDEDETKKDTSETKETPYTETKPARKFYRTAPSFTTFSTFCKTTEKSSPQHLATSRNQVYQGRKTTPTTSKPFIQSSHTTSQRATYPRIRDFPHPMPSPKRLRLDDDGVKTDVGITRDDPPAAKCAVANILQLEKSLEPKSIVANGHAHVEVSLKDSGCHPSSKDDINGPGQSWNKFQSIARNVSLNSSEGKINSFCSASGKAIAISDEALNQAKKLMTDVDKQELPVEFQLNLKSDEPCRFQSASGNSIAISEPALSKAKRLMDEVGRQEEGASANILSPAVGFSSASGNAIKISASAMAKARTIMADVAHAEEIDSSSVKVPSHFESPAPDGGGDNKGRMFQESLGTHFGNGQGKERKDYRRLPKGFRPFKPPSSLGSCPKIPVTQNPSKFEDSNTKDVNVLSTTGLNGKSEDTTIQSTDSGIHDSLHESSLAQRNDKAEGDERGQSSSVHHVKKTAHSDEVETSEDDCMTATQVEREIKAAEEMELVYNFMKEEDAGFSQLDVSSVLGHTPMTKGHAHFPEASDERKHVPTILQKVSKSNVISKTGSATGNDHEIVISVPNDCNEVTISQGLRTTASEHLEVEISEKDYQVSSKNNDSNLDVAFVDSQLSELSQESCLSGHPNLNNCPREALRDERGSKSEQMQLKPIDSFKLSPRRHVITADLSMNTVQQLLDESSMLMEEHDTNHIDTHKLNHRQGNGNVDVQCIPHLSIENADAPKALTTSQESKVVAAAMDAEQSLSYQVEGYRVNIIPPLSNITEGTSMDSQSSCEDALKTAERQPFDCYDGEPLPQNSLGKAHVRSSNNLNCSEDESVRASKNPASTSVNGTLGKGVQQSSDNVDRSKAIPTVVNFQTAGGSHVKISEASMAKAKQLLNSTWEVEECSITSSTNLDVPQRVGFQTARGGKINISEASLKKAKQLLASEGEHESPKTVGTSSVQVALGNVGFKTARGNSISISEASLKKARQFPADENEHESPKTIKPYSVQEAPGTRSTSLDVPSRVGFQTARGGSINISEASLKKAKRLLADEDECESPKVVQPISVQVSSGKVGFQTARGNAIIISEASLKKARQFLADEDEHELPKIAQPTSVQISSGKVGFQTARGNAISISEPPLKKARQFLADEDEHELPRIAQPTSVQILSGKVGFQTAGGNAISISEASLKKARQFLADEDEHELPKLVKPTSVPVSSGKVGFQTARGNAISISEASLKKARQLLADEDEHKLPKLVQPTSVQVSSGKVGFQTARGNAISISDASLKKARELLADENVCVSPKTVQPTSVQVPSGNVGFQTARGNAISISEASLKKARQLLADEDEHELPKVVQPSSVQVSSGKVGFQTARGNDISISEASLKKARQLLADNEDSQNNVNHTFPKTFQQPPIQALSGKVGFQTARGDAIRISETSLKKARQLLACDAADDQIQTNKSLNEKASTESPSVIGFQTARGSAVSISEESLQAAKQFLDRDAADDHTHTHETFKEPIPEASPPVIGFQTGRGTKIHVSESSLMKAKQLLSDESNCERASSAFQVPDIAHQEQKASSFRGVVGFQTGAGRKVEISESSLQRAKELLGDPLEEPPSHKSYKAKESTAGKSAIVSTTLKKTEPSNEYGTMHTSLTTHSNNPSSASHGRTFDQPRFGTGFQTGGGKSVQISQTSLQKAKALLADDAETGGPAVPTLSDSTCQKDIGQGNQSKGTKPVVGFTTGGGRTVSVSEESLKQAKNLFASDTVPITGTNKTELNIQNASNSVIQRHKAQTNIKGGMIVVSQAVPTVRNVQEKNLEARLPAMSVSSSVAMARKQMDPQSRVGRTSRGTGQKPYKPPRRLQDNSSSDRGLSPKLTNPTVVLEDRSNLMKSKHSAPPLEQDSKSLNIDDLKSCNSGPFIKSGHEQLLAGQSESSDGATPTAGSGSSLVAVWDMARAAQQQRIKAKKTQTTKPEMGCLWRRRKQEERISLREFVEHQHPSTVSSSELFIHGVLTTTLSITASNAESFEFAAEDHFSPSCLESREGIPLADGGRLVLSPRGLAGKGEFYSALLDTPGVDPRLLQEAWVSNHYRWIIWKLAALEVAYPQHFGGRLLTPNWVLLHLKYRYDREIDHSQRSALKKVMERDDAASRRMVLCVASVGTQTAPKDAEEKTATKTTPPTGQPVLELTDGWYSVPAAIDKPLAGLVRSGKIQSGTKLCIYGAEIIGSQDACSPLEIPAGLMLKLTCNSTRRARFDARLGLQPDPRPFPLPITSLHPEGGSVGCVDVVVLRAYPMQFMERLAEGGTIFRTAREEGKAAALHARQKQAKMEALYAQVHKQFESKPSHKGSGGRGCRSMKRRSRSWAEIEKLNSGEELYEAMEAAIDPVAFQSQLSERQAATLQSYQRTRCEMAQTDLQTAFKQALSDHTKQGQFERTVTPLLKLRIVDYKPSNTRWQQTCFLTIWRPSDDVASMLKEGKRFKMNSLSASAGRHGQGMASAQLASTRATRYEELPPASHILHKAYIPRAAASMQWLARGYTQAAYGELDIVGMVVSAEEGSNKHPGSTQSPAVYFGDEDGNLMMVKFWTSLKALHLDDILKRGSLVSASNLQYRSTHQARQPPLPTATASDYTSFTLNPRAPHLQAALHQLKAHIQDVPKFLEVMQSKIQSLKNAAKQSPLLTPVNRPYQSAVRRDRIPSPLVTPAASKTSYQNITPARTSALSTSPQNQSYQPMTVRSCPKKYAGSVQQLNQTARTPQQNSFTQGVIRKQGNSDVRAGVQPPRTVTQPSRLGVQTPRMVPLSPMSASPDVDASPRLAAQQRDIARRSLLLSRIPSPPPLTPLPCASPALRRGFKTPFVHGRGGTSSLRKRLRDELEEEENNSPSKLKCVHRGEPNIDDNSNNSLTAPTVGQNHGCTEDIRGKESSNEQKSQSDNFHQRNGDQRTDHPLIMNHSQGDVKKDGALKVESDENFDDLLGLSASGIRELDMSWSQSQPTGGAVTQEATKTASDSASQCSAVEGEHSDDKSATDGDVHDGGLEMPGSKTSSEEAGNSCNPRPSLNDIPNMPLSETSTNQIISSTINTKCPQVTSDENSTDRLKREVVDSKGQVSMTEEEILAHKSLSRPSVEHLKPVTNTVQKKGDCCINQVSQMLANDTESQDSRNCRDASEISKEAKDACASLTSDATNMSREADEACVKSTSNQQNVGSQNGTQNTTGASESSEASPGRGKKRCLSRRGRKARPRPQEVIEIWEDDLPLSQPKRSARLRGKKTSYKL